MKRKGDPGTVTRRISPRLNNLSPTVDDPTPTFSRITTWMSPKSFVDVLRHLYYNQWCALEEIGFSSLFWLRGKAEMEVGRFGLGRVKGRPMERIRFSHPCRQVVEKVRRVSRDVSTDTKSPILYSSPEEFADDYTASAKRVMEDMVVLDEKYAVGLQCFPGEECVKQAHSATEFVYLTYGGGTEDVSCAPPWESSTLDEDEQFIVVANAAEKAYKLKLARAKHREQCAMWRNSSVPVTGEFSFDLGLEKDFAESEARLAAAKGVKRDRPVTGESSSRAKRVHFMASPSFIPLSSNKQLSSRFDPLFSAIQDDTNVLTPLTAVHLQVAEYVSSDRGTNNRRSSPGLSDENIYELFEARVKMELQLFPGLVITSIALIDALGKLLGENPKISDSSNVVLAMDPIVAMLSWRNNYNVDDCVERA
ncbi:uncharacterized protein LOC141620168 [Silene latifolia]|uniref:uncharacterized protein LOC141620168 n=1 Tax=Silene latifolia TaxID=37657 RepID=UPI003D7781B6